MSTITNDLESTYEYFIRGQLAADAQLMSLIGQNTRTQAPNIYFQVAEEGAGDLVVIFDYAGRSRNHSAIPAETLFADADFLVVARGPRSKSAQLRQINARIRAALHAQSGATPDGLVLFSEETDGFVQPPWQENGVLQTGRGGFYNMWVQPPSGASLVDRAAAAVASGGWRKLGLLPSPGFHFHETDVFYNSDDGYYYAFNTEGDGNIPGWNSASVISWSATPGTATFTLSGPHGIPANGKSLGVVKFVALTNDNVAHPGGIVGNLTNTSGLVCYAPNAFTLVALHVANSASSALTGNGGNASQAGAVASPNLGPQVGMHRATGAYALTDLADKLDADYVSRVAAGLWYPTVVYVPGPTPVWHLFGTTAVNEVRRQSFTGAHPATIKAFGTLSLVTTLPIGDVQIRRNPADGYWYAVGGNDPNYWRMRVYKSANNTDITVDGWTLIGNMGSVWDDIGVPAWAAYAIPDPNLAFVDGRVYLLFTGRSSDPTPNSTGIVELDATTFKAKGTVAVLMNGSGAYPSWANGNCISDLTFVRCPDGVDRIIGFTGGPFDGTGQGVWACLDLAP